MPAPRKKSDSAAVILPPLNIGTVNITLIGDSPLIVHNWSKKAKTEILDKQMKKPPKGRVAKDPEQDYRESLYLMKDGSYGFPSVAFKAAAIEAISSVPGVTKVAMRQAFHVLGELSFVPGAFTGVKARMDLVKIEGADPVMREDMVRVAMTTDIRYRGEFWPWWTTIKVRYNAATFSLEQILNVFNIAGFGVGVGEWRSEKQGNYGLFHCATEAEGEALGLDVPTTDQQFIGLDIPDAIKPPEDRIAAAAPRRRRKGAA